jgi:hypothetical protein
MVNDAEIHRSTRAAWHSLLVGKGYTWQHAP